MFASIMHTSPTRFDSIGTDDFMDAPEPTSANHAADFDDFGDSNAADFALAHLVTVTNVTKQIREIFKMINASRESLIGDPTVKYKGHVFEETRKFLNRHGFKVFYPPYDRYNNTQWAFIYPDDAVVCLSAEEVEELEKELGDLSKIA